MRFFVAFALDRELAAWRKRGGFRAERREGAPGWRKRQGEVEVLALATGAGTENARRETAAALGSEPFDLVISAGLAGGLRPQHQPGTLLVGRKVIRLADGQALIPSGRWTQLAAEQGAKEAALATAERVATTPEEKRRLGEQADAVEMESYAVLEAAAARDVPAVAVRAVSDAAQTRLPVDFNRVLGSGGRVSGAALAAEVARRPWAIPGLLRLARSSRLAESVLAVFLERYTRAAAEAAAAGLPRDRK